RAVQGVIVPGAAGHDRTWGTFGRDPHRCDAFGNHVSPCADFIDLWVEHFVHGDKFWSDNIPVRMLEGQVQVIQRMKAGLKDLCYAVAVFFLNAWCGVICGIFGHESPFLMRTYTSVACMAKTGSLS